MANLLRLDDDDNESASLGDEENDVVTNESQSSEDLTELTQSLTCQFWGVASFLALPPPPSLPPPLSSPHSLTEFNSQSNVRSFSNLNQSVSEYERDPSYSAVAEGIRDDFAEIGGRLSKMASEYFSFGSRENREGNEMENENEEVEEFNPIGVMDEVLAFARNIPHHLETWLGVPLDPNEDLDDFDMSVAQ
ncbi:hypothetical protein PTKIN_Ptkin09bG0149900 [Pterospermum kingtungense]